MADLEKEREIPLQEEIGKKGSEVALYLTIKKISDDIGFAFDQFNKGVTKGQDKTAFKKSIIDRQINLYRAVQQTVCFGVPEPVVNDLPSDEFTLWWKWWNDYAETNLSPRDRRLLSGEVEKRKDVSRWKPEGDWREDSTGQKATIPSLSLPI